ncbi:MAG: Gfo/Idh/MocA family oxidoreductase [Gammaproteobacteria bacterium]|nr:Gfo/Idh/MocA family oxidoreductase [Gammaproteobacteria bacterium]
MIPDAGEALSIGILGTGRISTQFALALHESGSCTVRIAAVAGRDGERAAALAQRCAAPRSYAGYGAMLADDSITAVYIGLPNSLHAEWAVRAATAGRHVLCEKPLAPSLEEARRMVEACERHGVLLVEAYPYQFQPQTIEMCRCIAAGEIGTVRVLQATTGYPLAAADSPRMQSDMAGGALLDVGCYGVSLARLVFARQPRCARAQRVAGSSGVDLTTVATLEYDDGAYAQLACSLATAPHRNAFLIGSDGALQTSFSNHTVPGSAALRIKRGVSWEAVFQNLEVPAGNGFVLEAEAFARAVVAGGGAARSSYHRHNLDNAATLAAIAASMRTGQPVPV